MEQEEHVVIGEADESSDDEQNEIKTSPRRTDTPQAVIVSGEAPESDEETHQNPIESTSEESKNNLPQADHNYDSLLHKKLFECNASLRANIISFIYKTVGAATSQLSETEQQLLKSQMRLQNAGTAFRMLNTTSNQLGDKLSNMACTSYIPHINIPK